MLLRAFFLVTAVAATPSIFLVEFQTDRGPFTVEVHRDWAPIGADHFHTLVEKGFYDECKVFRAVRNFMVQFGISARPGAFGALERQSITDDPPQQSNAFGTVTFATSGPDSRSTQIFVSTRDNSYLDSMGFTPFGRVTSGMNVVTSLFTGYGEETMQYNAEMQSEGNDFLERSFPRLSTIRSARLTGGGGFGGQQYVVPRFYALRQEPQTLSQREDRLYQLGLQRGFSMPQRPERPAQQRPHQPPWFAQPLEQGRYVADDPLQEQNQRLNEMWEEKGRLEREQAFASPVAFARSLAQRMRGGVQPMQPDDTM